MLLEARDDLGERLVRTVLGVWDSELQPSLVAAIRTTLTDPALTRSVGEFLALEVIGQVLRRDDLPPEEANRRAGLVASQILGLLMGRYVSAHAGSGEPPDRGPGSRDRPDRPALRRRSYLRQHLAAIFCEMMTTCWSSASLSMVGTRSRHFSTTAPIPTCSRSTAATQSSVRSTRTARARVS